MTNLLDEIEALKADTKLSPEERKKAIKSLKRKARRAAIKSGEHTVVHKETATEKKEAQAALTFDELVKTVGTYYAEHCKAGDPKSLGYAFSLRQAANLQVHDPAAFANKFKSRWGYEPTTYFTLAKGMDVLLFLGPVHTGN